MCLASSKWDGLTSNLVERTSRALEANFEEETSNEAWLWLRMYSNSGAGKAGESGSAMDRAARAARSVTGNDGKRIPIRSVVCHF